MPTFVAFLQVPLCSRCVGFPRVPRSLCHPFLLLGSCTPWSLDLELLLCPLPQGMASSSSPPLDRAGSFPSLPCLPDLEHPLYCRVQRRPRAPSKARLEPLPHESLLPFPALPRCLLTPPPWPWDCWRHTHWAVTTMRPGIFLCLVCCVPRTSPQMLQKSCQKWRQGHWM